MMGKASVTFTARPDRELLIMVHRKHRVGAIHWFRDEGRIRGKGVLDEEPFRTHGLDRRNDMIDLLGAEVSALPRTGV